MQENRKKWISLGVALASGVSTSALAADFVDHNHTHSNIVLAAAGEGEGEGEGEGAGVTVIDLKVNDVAYLTRLGLIRGHLLVGYQLYSEGKTEMAITHMKHPRDELYTGLVPAIEHRGGERFDAALTKLADSITNKASQEAVTAAYQDLEKGIKAAESVVDIDLKTSLQSIKELVRTAADEYAIGVEEGKLVNVHEYQDAYGFVELAKRRLDELPEGLRQQSADSFDKVNGYLNGVSDMWPGIAPEGDVDGDASRLYGAAARIEIEALNY
ncbi:hypothetical protein Q7C_1864 [Methylophaga frappieri]|uniref:DUF3829 domain-containing protein n=1 Tax=Methylophaga frappieri (strain ATCC BAA-2434 / DSM 25690 / JAM7) TaxID=754477 RepID=I1YJB2_METFJ|nr:hypothetical protein [Methylophaga frappieri]AFJ03005.1 hypothetical protein Q7C_1864 [Methylophaga frappieri]